MSSSDAPNAPGAPDAPNAADLEAIAQAEQAARQYLQARRARNQRQTLAIVIFVLAWTYVYNLSLKREGPILGFFRILDTISDDFVMGSLLTVGIGLLIIVVFSATKFYGQIVANAGSFRLLEHIAMTDLRQGRWRDAGVKLLYFRDQPNVDRNCPRYVSSILLSFCFIYLMSGVYVFLFSEALYFASWSSGVRPQINERTVLLMPTLALAIPFSSRVMAYFRYPYAQDFADLMPAATFVLLLVTAIGVLFESTDQEFYLGAVFANRSYTEALLNNSVFLAFIPVFSEAIFWLIELLREDIEQIETKA